MPSSILRDAPSAHSVQSQSPFDANTAFAFDLFGHLRSVPGNLFFSPYSISTALAMTYAGARGDTETQMARVLHLEQEQQEFHSSFGKLQLQLDEANKQKGVELSIANTLWMHKGYSFMPAFLEIATSDYQTNVNQADFETGAEAARDEINRWVAIKTKDKIQDILASGSLNGLTRLVLANAIYFKEGWAKPFDKAKTYEEPFYLSATKEVNVPMMHHSDEVRYMENSDFQAVELPYKSNEFSMVILLPRKVDGCGELESRLTPALLSSSLNQMEQQKVEIFLPRFKLESAFDLPDTLSAMGMPDAFVEEKADFSGIDGTRLLFISGVFHKTWVEVNEEGTEAAAMMAVLCQMRGANLPPPVFCADHPFIFFIRDMSSGSHLFLGRLANPACE